jgi:cyclopropane-fatty-acyl-phospholipid synthase
MDAVSRYLLDTATLPDAEKRLLALFQHLECGRLRIGLPSGQTVALRGALPGPEADLMFPHPESLSRLADSGLNALAEAFAHGGWQSRNLTRLLYLLCLNPLLFPAPTPQTLPWPQRLRQRLIPTARHSETPPVPLPDVSFFQSWLGKRLDDGPALFQSATDTPLLAQASAVEALLQALGEVRTSDHLLEIGGGWGVLSEVLARSGARLTVQGARAATARHIHARLSALTLRQPVTVKETPVLRLKGRYDRIIWVMRPTEPIPEDWEAVFRHLKTLLKQGGRFILQSLTAAPGTPAGLRPVLFPDGQPPEREKLILAASAAYLGSPSPLRFGEGIARLYGSWRAALESAAHVDTPPQAQIEARRWLYQLAALEAAQLAETLVTEQFVFTHQHEGGAAEVGRLYTRCR